MNASHRLIRKNTGILRAITVWAMLLLTSCGLMAKKSGNSEKMAVAGDTLTVCDVFTQFPDSYLSIIPRATRLDMMDYLKADSLIHVRNVYKGESWVIAHSPGYLKVHITNVSTLQIKQLYDKKKGNVFMAIYTVSGDGVVADSQVLFFNDEMKQVETSKYFRLPDPKIFWETHRDNPKDKESRKEKEDLEQAVPFYAIEYSVSPENDILTGRIASISFLSEEMKAKIMPLLRKEITWNWNGRRYEPSVEK